MTTNKTKAELEVDISKLEAEIERLKTEGLERDTSSDGMMAMQAEIDRLNEETKRLEGELVTLRDELDGNEEEGAAHDTIVNDLNTSLAGEKERADAAEKQLAAQVAELDQLRHDNSKWRSKYETLATRGQALHGHIDDLKAPY